MGITYSEIIDFIDPLGKTKSLHIVDSNTVEHNKYNKTTLVTKDKISDTNFSINKKTIKMKLTIPRNNVNSNSIINNTSNMLNSCIDKPDTVEWDVLLVKLLSVMDTWSNFTKNKMAPENMMWGWRYFMGNNIFSNLDNVMVKKGALDLNLIIDKCCENIDHSSKKRTKFSKFSEKVSSKMITYANLVKNTTNNMETQIKENLYEEYKNFKNSNLEYLEFMNSPEWIIISINFQIRNINLKI